MPKTINKTLSIPIELQQFLNENPDLSASKMLQSKIIEVRENRRIRFEEIARKDKQIKILQDKLWDANEKVAQLEEKISKCKKCSGKK